MAENEVKIGDIVFVVDPGLTASAEDRQNVIDILDIYSKLPEFRDLFSGPGMDHQITQHNANGDPIVEIFIQSGVEGGGYGSTDYVADTDMLYKVSNADIYIDPAEIDDSQYFSPDTNEFHEESVAAVLANELGNLAAMLNHDLPIDGPGHDRVAPLEAHTNGSFGYPYGPHPNPSFPGEANGDINNPQPGGIHDQDGPIETFSATVEDIIHEIFGEPKRHHEGSGSYDTNSGAVGSEAGNQPIWKTFSDWYAALQDRNILKLPPEAAQDASEGAYVAASKAAFAAAKASGSPLVLDLDGDGVELVALDDSNTYWDIDQDNYAELTGWVQADDGFLAIDTNLDGIITDHSELFGDLVTDGFTDLNALDSNSDLVINSSDTQFSDLLIWRDINQNGYSEGNEIFTLADLDIVSIDIDATAVNQTNAGHDISHISTYTMDDGVSGPQTRSIVDVWFEYDNVNATYTGEYDPDDGPLLLATQRGYGLLPDMHIAVSLDNDINDPDSLINLLTEFSEKTFSELFTDDGSTLDDVRNILFRWAGVDDVDPSSRGAHVDGRELEFMEKFMGEEFLQGGILSNPGGYAGEMISLSFDIVLDAVTARLTAYNEGFRVFSNGAFYNPNTDEMEGVAGLSQYALDQLVSKAQDASQTSDKVAFWKGVVNVIDQLVGVANLSTADQTALETAIVTSDSTLTTAQILDALEWGSEVGDVMGGTTGNDTLSGTVGNDNITSGNGNDTIYGGIGNDILSGDNGDDVLYGQTGNDYLAGGGGADTYKYVAGQGDDAIAEENTQIDTLEFISPAVTLADLTILRVPNAGLLITLDTDVGGGSVRIASGNLEILKFADATTFDLRTMNQTLIGTSANETLHGMLAGSMGTGVDIMYGMGGNDTLNVGAPNETDSVVNYAYGGDGNDTVNGDTGNDQLWGDAGNDTIYGAQGNDTVTGGTGDDVVRGYQGNDIYNFNLGDGNDTLREDAGTDKIIFGAGITQADLSIYRISNRDVKIDISGGAGGSIILQDQTYGTGQNYVTETLQFNDGSTLNLTTYNLTLNGTSAGETLTGVKFGGSGVDTIYGHGGNDIIYGYGGSAADSLANTLSGGDGDDTVHGANGVDTIAGDAGNDTLYGYDGNDVIEGGIGNDTIGGGDHNDTLYGNDGADALTGGNNNDTLIGGLGADTLTGSGGNDIFKFLSGQSLDAVDSITDFNTTYDKIDVADLIDFDPLTHVITDFVQITTSGANSNLAVDTDGGGNNFIQIAVILNKTGLTDEAALLAGGQLLAA